MSVVTVISFLPLNNNLPKGVQASRISTYPQNSAVTQHLVNSRSIGWDPRLEVKQTWIQIQSQSQGKRIRITTKRG
ncbi:hypothetical protein VN97_g10094 [Penicillium thymicola]|uniref:Uncharacterized protein n=1 Tax=Penicillium thymicola TaxID=293382 RepID=A0AAI9TAB4_PENTH|nr:hypothetical protein VN97_g10094 [Penicillium thymicola]